MALFVTTIIIKNADIQALSAIKKGLPPKLYRLIIYTFSEPGKSTLHVELERQAQTIETVVNEVLSVLEKLSLGFSFTITYR
ncbi:hypothetical protein QTN47_20185 [Danxiaibacter flavus]|uniref:Uncharacterized protein n=2 Tax=Danxiaibacter flavus TaxID=3049108 RepID=A0ABV3ZIX9_9BACT|nr:hypothetical protein QNM32_20195 [Chitinophagaceae bacterium DXS]